MVRNTIYVIMAEKLVKIGLAGFGTVGSGVAKLILEDADSIAAKTGLRLQLACVVDIDTKRSDDADSTAAGCLRRRAEAVNPVGASPARPREPGR